MKNIMLWGILVLLLAPFALSAELTQLSVHAPSVQEGAEITLTYTLVDDNAIGPVKTDVYLSNGINHQSTAYARGDVYKHTQTFRLPRTFQGDEQVRVRISVDDQYPIIATVPLQSSSNRNRAQTNSELPTDSETGVAVVVDPVRDTFRGEAIYYRARIINTDDQPHLVTVGLSDVSDWATYRVDPYPTVQLAAGETHEAYIYLKVDEDAPAGITYFDVTADYQGMQERATVKLAVLQELHTEPLENLRPWIIAIALVLLVAAAVFAAYTHLNGRDEDEQEGGDDDDFITYY